MDWPVIGAITGVTIVAGAVIFEVVAFVKADPEPVKTAQLLSSYGSSVERSANELPGFATGKSGPPAPSFPLIRLIDPDRTFPIEGRARCRKPPRRPSFRGPQKSSGTIGFGNAGHAERSQGREADPAGAKGCCSPTFSRVQTSGGFWSPRRRATSIWAAMSTAMESSTVIASSRLRDALKEHKNFARLPPDIRTHILTQNINLAKVAPYRGLLGIDDKRMEEEQAIKFERVASTR